MAKPRPAKSGAQALRAKARVSGTVRDARGRSPKSRAAKDAPKKATMTPKDASQRAPSSGSGRKTPAAKAKKAAAAKRAAKTAADRKAAAAKKVAAGQKSPAAKTAAKKATGEPRTARSTAAASGRAAVAGHARSAHGGAEARVEERAAAQKAQRGESGRNHTAKLRYQVNEQVVYPLHGVGKVLRIEERPFLDRRLLYYIIYIEVSDMTVMVPVDKADELGIRPIVEPREAQKALKLISEQYEPVPSDWKLRYQMNLDLLKSGSITDIATVVRTLYHRSKIKELPILERKLYDSALRLLIDEAALSLGKGKEEVEQMIYERLESARSKPK